MAMRRKLWITILCGFLIGLVTFFSIRFALAKNEVVHYHANLAVYINGEREKFDNFTYYEEIASCEGTDHDNPKSRVHLHGNVNSVVHVHDNAVTWGALFANLGYTLGDSLIKTDKSLYVDGQDGKELSFTLNGQKVKTAANRVIQSEDVMLISYGDPLTTDRAKEYASIKQDAGEYNAKQDPSSCQGSEPLTLQERLKKAFGIN